MIVDRGLDTEQASPKYAQCELERRWLVEPCARPSLEGANCTLVEDRYIDGTRLRLRRMTRGDRCVLKLTKKYESDRPEARPVVTAYLTEAEYAVFAALPARAVRKRRYHLPFANEFWSLDVFDGPLAGLEVLEIEATDEAALAVLVPPPWAAKEVTHDARYQGGSLVRNNRFPE